MSRLSKRHRIRSAQGKLVRSPVCAKSPPTLPVLTLVPMRSSLVCPTVKTSRSCGPSAPPPRISTPWPTGLSIVASRPSPWHPQACIGFHCLRIPEARGLSCCLISAQSIKRVPGRKSDVLDCQWMQTLHSFGTDMSKWPDEKHLCAWLGLAPKHDISGGKVLKSRTISIATVPPKPSAWRRSR